MYPKMPYPPRDYHICPCCGTEFGNDDADRSHEELREEWLSAGARWFFGNPPQHWNPLQQLLNAGMNYSFVDSERQLSIEPNIVGNIKIEIAETSDESEFAIAV